MSGYYSSLIRGCYRPLSIYDALSNRANLSDKPIS